MDRGAEDHPVAGVDTVNEGVDPVLAAEETVPVPAAAAADAAVDGLIADPEEFRLQALSLHGGGHLPEGGIGAAVLMGAAVDQKDFHGTLL